MKKKIINFICTVIALVGITVVLCFLIQFTVWLLGYTVGFKFSCGVIMVGIALYMLISEATDHKNK